MISTRRGFLRGLAAAVAVAAFPTTTYPTPAAAASPRPGGQIAPARSVQPGADWVSLGPDVSTGRFFVPASGALFVTAGGGLMRSDDAGATWRQIALPQRKLGSAVTIDPTNHLTIYVDSLEGLQRSEDDGLTWTTILPSEFEVRRIEVSAADPGVIYVARNGGPATGEFWLHRSRDRGASWEQIDEARAVGCGWSVAILAAHPTDPARLFRTSGCYAGRNVGDDLRESRDNGATWRTAFTPKTAFPKAIVGGSGADPGRFYLAVNNDYRSGGSLVFTSADDAASWSPILEHQGGGTMQGSKVPSITIAGLAYDPAAPERVFVAQQSKMGTARTGVANFVSASADGGASWQPLGRQDLPEIRDLALGIDGRNLFAATEHGVWRLALG